MSEETIPESNEKNKEFPDEVDDILPLIQPEISESNLIKLSHKDFTKEQIKSHEAAAAHLGVTKTKDAIFKTFYWPKCFSDVEDFVKICDKCQRVGKPQDKKKAPLKIVHAMTEIFPNINIDASRPLPMTPGSCVLCLEAIPDWEKIPPQALFSLKTVIHDSTGFSPAELVHGKNLRTPVMLLYEKLTEEELVESSVVDYVFELINRMKRCQELWVDPGEIMQQLSETNYVVKFPEKDKTHVYHVNMLKPYHQREENINLLCINPLKHDEEEDMPSLELENEMSGWSKIISDVQLNSKLSQIQRGPLKELLYEDSNFFSNIPGCTTLAEHDIELESE
ncbi:retrovirus-related Pol polyprotein from transposon 412 [Trichonephila clavipes]|nr:retrovirus-related Pol polyprotein from transposon 412 [Trichonephila clavipes]